jgi:general secretion pathway protein J
MSRAATRRRCAGFTLIEAMLATLLMVIILGALATVTAQWLPNWDRGVTRLQRVEILTAGLDRLVADLASAQFVSTGGTNIAPLFDGAELSVTFIRTALGPNTVTGLEVVQIAETSDERGIVLVRRTAPFAPFAGNARQGAQLNFANPVAMIRAPYRISFSYAGPDHVWQDTWRDAAQLPRAIRVRVRDAATSRTLAVSTSTLVHAELPARCALAKTIAECPGIVFSANAASVGGLQGR